MITSDARRKCGIKSRIAIPKAAFNKKKALRTERFDTHLRKKQLCIVLKLGQFGKISNTWKA
jgi:hypothetical protein